MDKPLLMGILNVTPDSFSNDGEFLNVRTAVTRARQLIKEGASIIDIGGEASGPGSVDVPVQEELRRVIPVVKKLAPFCRKKKVLISIDTYKAEVAWQAIAAGASIVNDVTALRGDSEMASVITKTGARIILMYSKDPTARTTRTKKRYRNVVVTAINFFKKQIAIARAAGIKREQIIIDPGMGMFVSAYPKYSFEIIRRLREFKKLGYPILIGISKKSCLPGALTEREIPTLIAGLAAWHNGADILRIHDVAAHRKFMQLQLPRLMPHQRYL